jgi:hypothetical protein
MSLRQKARASYSHFGHLDDRKSIGLFSGLLDAVDNRGMETMRMSELRRRAFDCGMAQVWNVHVITEQFYRSTTAEPSVRRPDACGRRGGARPRRGWAEGQGGADLEDQRQDPA